MQTFLPYPSFSESAAVLDTARLGKQRVETLQLLRANTVPDYGWRHHPAAKMWRGYLPALVSYGLAMTDAWTAAGRADTVREQLLTFAPGVDGVPQAALDMPPWLGDEALHLSHRSNLVRKDPEFYRPHFGGIPDDLPYVWPPAPGEPAAV
ncbi:MSMEG_6728 family protein [Microbacterium oleivorans]|uniref:MSMEG_6728 family protein n=1 Tax=Microbacterium oleivorans TaxID=273677 RepID=A0A7D5F3D1_9MICO|nr:MSMEG_6728 family protein [Microbacterium oleivorans]QLD10347.1 MSMEG_6728 family protein [Microbacterium oleivorans]